MALSALELNTISRGINLAKQMLDLYGEMKQLNVLYDSAGGVKSTVTQQGLDGVASFSGLTKQQLDDAFFVLTATIRTDMDNGIAQLAELSARG